MISRRDTFQALADPTRRGIISLLAHDALNLHTLAANFDVSRPAISQHIKLLIECELVRVELKGRESICHLQIEKLDEVRDWLEPLRKTYMQRFSKLEKVLSAMKKTKKK